MLVTYVPVALLALTLNRGESFSCFLLPEGRSTLCLSLLIMPLAGPEHRFRSTYPSVREKQGPICPASLSLSCSDVPFPFLYGTFGRSVKVFICAYDLARAPRRRRSNPRRDIGQLAPLEMPSSSDALSRGERQKGI